jgi:hypothetical protein
MQVISAFHHASGYMGSICSYFTIHYDLVTQYILQSRFFAPDEQTERK